MSVVYPDFQKDNFRRIASEAKFYESYSRFLEEENRYETWEESVNRVMNMHRKFYADKMTPELSKLIDRAEEGYAQKLFLGSQRALQYGGDQLLKNHMKLYNCTSSHCDRPEFFGEIFWILLSGCGAGFSVQKHHVANLPKIKERHKNAKTFTIPDSIEGWAQALDVLMSSFFEGGGKHPEFEGRRVYFDTTEIREKDAYISGGFKAPGPEPLRVALDKIERILTKVAKENRQLKPVEAYDITMHAADAVIAGGVRRSATICLFSIDDEEMMNAKTGQWYIDNPQRGRSNNSAVCVRGEITYEQFKYLYEKTKQFGEPGFYFVTSREHATNPCVEIGMLPKYYPENNMRLEDGVSGWQGCVSYDTKILTRDGISVIGEVADKGESVEVWNGEKWSKVSPIQTGENRKLYRVHFGDGSYLDATSNHRFLVKHRFEKNYREVTTSELIEEISSTNYVLSVPRSDVKYSGGVNEPLAYDYGFILGDGTIGSRSNGKIRNPFASVYATNYEYNYPFVSEPDISKELYDEYNGLSSTYINVYFNNVDNSFAYRIKYDDGLPKSIFSWERKSIMNFFAGWIDTDGTITQNGSVRIYSSEDKVRDAQLLLTKHGINSSVNLMAKKGSHTNMSVRNRDVWYIQIMPSSDMWCSKAELVEKNAKFKGKNQTVRSVEEIDGLHNSYCFEEPELHQGVFGNVLTKQCNLTEINGTMCKSEEIFYEACELAAIVGTLQAGYTDFKFVTETTKKIFEREALLGVSVTGWMGNPEVLFNEEVLRKGARIVKNTNKRVARLIGINPAARNTCAKPAGNSSVILMTPSGFHAEHAPMYFRNIQMSMSQEVAQLIKKTNPYMVEKSVWSSTGTDYVISFPFVPQKGSYYRHQCTDTDFLEKVKFAQSTWVEEGTDTDLCVDKTLRHNISNTTTVTDGKWDEVGDFIFENRDYFSGISLLGEIGDKDFNQAPNTEVKTASKILDEYGESSMFASGLIVDALSAFGDLWVAIDFINFDLAIDENDDKRVLKEDWIRRFRKFSEQYHNDLKTTEYLLKDVHLLHKWNKIANNYQPIDWINNLDQKEYTDINTLAALSCHGGACDIL